MIGNKRIINFIYEAAVVKRLKRTGWQILGDNEESLGEHTFMTAVISYSLAKQLHADIGTVLTMAIFHDFHEGRTGDMDKIAQFYVKRDQGKANRDIFQGVDDDVIKTLEIYEHKKTLEAKIVYEANIIALLVELKILMEKGNVHAKEWFDGNTQRLRLPLAKSLASELQKTSTQDWWKHIRKNIHEGFIAEG